MDLFLMDLILKGKVPENSSVLDIGCGEGRNGIYFIQNGYEYHGWDMDASKLNLIAYLSDSLSEVKAHFKEIDIIDADSSKQFDFIICSRVLHLAKSEQHFFEMWGKVKSLLLPGGMLYASMDSVIDNNIASHLENGQYEFPDTKVRFALTREIYKEIKKGFDEIEPLRTVVHHNERAQSFFIFKKMSP
ncbi:MAG: class I SAM-dependent methyltransferase [Ekhidna sp.]